MANSDSDKCVWINGITESTTILQLQDLCRPYGKAMVIRLFKQKRKSDTSALVAMVKMATAEDADTLIDKLPLHFDKRLNITVTKKIKRRQKRESHQSPRAIHTGMLKEDGTKVKKQKLESDHNWPLNESGEPEEPVKKNSSWSLLRNSIEDLQCMGFSVLEGFSCLDGDEQVQRSKECDVKEHFHVKLEPLQNTENSLANMKGQTQAYPKSTEEFTQIMRKYLANLLGNEAAGPSPQGSHNHHQVSREVQNTKNLLEMGPEVIHERIKENYTHIKEWILTTCVPLSMAFKMASQADVNKELLSGALKCLLGIVHQIPQLKVRDLDFANEYEKKKSLMTRKEVVTNNASTQVLPETMSKIVQTLQIFSQSKYVQTEVESKAQESCEKTEHSKKFSAIGKQLGVPSVAKAVLASDICKSGCSKAVQTESICLPKAMQKNEFITKSLEKISSSRIEGQQYDLSNIASCMSGNLAKCTPSTSQISPNTLAQQNSCATRNETQNRIVSTKPMQSTGISCGITGKDLTSSLLHNKEIGTSLDGAKHTLYGVEQDRNETNVKENKVTFVAGGSGKENEIQTKTSKIDTKSSVKESICVKEKTSREQITSVAKSMKTRSVDNKNVKEMTSKGQETATIVKEVVSSPVESKDVKGKVSKDQKIAGMIKESKALLVKHEYVEEEKSKMHEMAAIIEETKTLSIEGKHVKEKGSEKQEVASIKEETRSLSVESRCVEGKTSKEEMASITEEKESPLAISKTVKGKKSNEQIVNIAEEAKSSLVESKCVSLVESKCVQEKAGKGEEITSTTEKSKGLLVENTCIRGKASKGQRASLAGELKTSLVEGKYVKGETSKVQMTDVAKGTESLLVDGKYVERRASKVRETAAEGEETKSPSRESKHDKGKVIKEHVRVKPEKRKSLSVEDKCVKSKASFEQDIVNIAEEARNPLVEGKCSKEKAVKGGEIENVPKEAKSLLIEGECIKGKSSKGQMASIADETKNRVVEGKCVKEKTGKGQITNAAEKPESLLVKDKCVSGKAEEEQKIASMDETKTLWLNNKCAEKEVMASMIEETKSPSVGDKQSRGKTSKEQKVSVSEKVKIPPGKGKSLKEKASIPEEMNDPFVEGNNLKGKTRKEQKTNIICEETEIVVVDDKSGKGETLASIVEETKTVSVEGSHVTGRASKEQAIAYAAEETKSISDEGKYGNKKVCEGQEKVNLAEEAKRPLVEKEIVKGGTVKEMASVPNEKNMKNIGVTGRRPSNCGIGERYVELESNKVKGETTGSHMEVRDSTKSTVKDGGVIDSSVKNMDTGNEVKGKGPYCKVGDPERMINILNFKNECAGGSEFKDVKLLGKIVKGEKSENVKVEDLKEKIKTLDSVMTLGRGKKELRESKRRSNVHCRTSEELDSRSLSDCRKLKVKVKCITSPRMILDLEEVSHLNKEPRVNNTILHLNQEKATGVESSEVRDVKHNITLSDCLPLSETVKRSAQDIERKAVKIEIDEDSLNRGEKRRMVKFECMGKNILSSKNESLTVPRKRAKVNQMEALDGGMEDDRKRESCRSTRSRSSLDRTSKLKMIGSQESDGLQVAAEDVLNESRLGREHKEDLTQTGRSSQSYTEVGRKTIQFNLDAELKDSSPTRTTDRSRDSTQSNRRLRQDSNLQKSFTNKQEEFTHIKDEDCSKICAQSRNELKECSALRNSVTTKICAQRSIDKPVEFRQTRSRDRQEHIKISTGDLDDNKQKSGGSSQKECKSKRNVDDKDDLKSDQIEGPHDKTERLKDEGMDVKIKETGREHVEEKMIDKNEKNESTKGEGRLRICKESKDVGERHRNYTEKEKTEKTLKSSKQISDESKVENPSRRMGNVDEKHEQACSSKLGEKQGSNDEKENKLLNECKQEKMQGKLENQKQTREREHADVQVVSKEVSKVSSRRSPRDTSRSSGKSKEDEVVMSDRRSPERKGTIEGSSSSCRHKEDSGAARGGRQTTCVRTAASFNLTSSHSSSHGRQKRGRENNKKPSKVVLETQQSRNSISKAKPSKIRTHNRSRSPIIQNIRRKLRSRKRCASSKSQRRYETSKTRNRSKDFDESKFRMGDNTVFKHKIPSANKHDVGKGHTFAISDKVAQSRKHMLSHGLSSKHHEGDGSISPNDNRNDLMEYVNDYRMLGKSEREYNLSGHLPQVADFKSIVNEYFESGSKQNHVNELIVPSQSSVAGTDPSSVTPYLSSYAENQFNQSYSPYSHYYNDSYYQRGPVYGPLQTCMSWSGAQPQVPVDISTGLPLPPLSREWEYTNQTMANQPYPQ